MDQPLEIELVHEAEGERTAVGSAAAAAADAVTSQGTFILFTASHLREATQEAIAREKKSTRRQCSDWVDWFIKRAPKMLKDAAARGDWEIFLDIPQPKDKKEHKLLKELQKVVGEMLPGCAVSFVEEDYEDRRIKYMMEISWKAVEGGG